MPAPTQNRFVLTIAEAIAHFEGFYSLDNTRAKRNNNPGNLKNWDRNNDRDDSGFDMFPTAQKGWDALYQQVEKNVFERELSLTEFFAGNKDYPGYAPGSNATHYAKFVEHFLEDRGFYPISREHNLAHWWINLSGARKEPETVIVEEEPPTEEFDPADESVQEVLVRHSQEITDLQMKVDAVTSKAGYNAINIKTLFDRWIKLTEFMDKL